MHLEADEIDPSGTVPSREREKGNRDRGMVGESKWAAASQVKHLSGGMPAGLG